MSTNPEHLTRRGRAAHAVWVGFAGGTLFGLTEAWTILARNAAETPTTLIGVIAAMGFVVALDGALGAIVLAVVGAIASTLAPLRRRFDDANRWMSLCTAIFAGLLTLLLALIEFGVPSGIVTGARAALFAWLSLLAAIFIGAVAYSLTRAVLKSIRLDATRLARRVITGIWIGAVILPLAFTILRGRLV